MGCRRCVHLRIALRRMDPVVALSDPAGHVPLQPRDFERPPPAPAPPRATVISRHGGLPVPVPCGSSESCNRRPSPRILAAAPPWRRCRRCTLLPPVTLRGWMEREELHLASPG
ncbi:hypothetical protein ACQJBY_064754 [Aegilops geniculata]